MPQFADLWLAGDRLDRDSGWSAEILQTEYGHEIVRLQGARISFLQQRYPSGAPVRLDWGRSSGQSTWFAGYVHHTKPRLTATRASDGQLVAVAASRQEFSGAGVSTWPAGAAAQVPVQSGAFQAHFSSVVEPCPLPAAGGPIHGESQWAYFVRNARAVGYTFYCRATDLRFHSRRVTQTAPVPTFRWYGAGVLADQQVFSYEFLQGDDLPVDGGQRRTREVRGISDQGDLVRLAATADLPDTVGWLRPSAPALTQGHPEAVHGYLMAQKKLTAVQEDNRFIYRAKVTVSGDERVHMASTIALAGVDRYLDGYWYVLSAKHNIGTASYSMDLELGRDALGDTSPAVVPQRQVVIGPGIREAQRPSPTVLERVDRTHQQLVMADEQNGRWASRDAESRYHLAQQGAVSG